MQKQEILRKAIEKAVANGYCPTDSGSAVANLDVEEHGVWFFEEDGTGAYWGLDTVFFSKDHSFARAFWGDYREEYEVCKRDRVWHNENCTDRDCRFSEYVEGWEQHLPKLVLAEDRLGYIEKFLD